MRFHRGGHEPGGERINRDRLRRHGMGFRVQPRRGVIRDLSGLLLGVRLLGVRLFLERPKERLCRSTSLKLSIQSQIVSGK